MIDWLYSFPDTILLALFALAVSALVVALPSLTQRLPFLRADNENTDVIFRIQATLFMMTSLMLAFTLLEAESNFRKVDALASAEASLINRLDRLLTRYDDASASSIRPHLHAYALSIAKEEWPEMLRGKTSDKTRLAFIPISRGILGMNPSLGRQTTIYAEILRSFDSIAEKHDARLNAVSVSLPASYWQVVLFAVLMLIFVSSTVARTPFRHIVLAGQMAVLGAFIGFVFIKDQPFKGQSAIDAKSIVQAISIMQARPE